MHIGYVLYGIIHRPSQHADLSYYFSIRKILIYLIALNPSFSALSLLRLPYIDEKYALLALNQGKERDGHRGEQILEASTQLSKH